MAVVAAAAVAVFKVVVATAATPTADWPDFLHDADGG